MLCRSWKGQRNVGWWGSFLDASDSCYGGKGVPEGAEDLYLSTHEQEAKLWELCATVCLAPLGPTRIAVALELIGAQAARRSEHRDALDLLLRARATVVKPPTRENRAERIGTYERALEIDPGSIETQSWLANSLAGRVLSNMTETPEADLARAEELVERA